MNDPIERLLPNLYARTLSDKLNAVKQIASLCDDAQTLKEVAQHEQLMSAFARLLADDSNVELSFTIGKILLAISEVEDFHKLMSSHRIGATILRASNSSGCLMTPSQEHFAFICLSILVNLADDVTTLRKMIKKGLVPVAVGCLLRSKSAKSQKVSLRLLQLSSIFEETAVEIANQGHSVISKLVFLLNDVVCMDIQSDVITILFNLSFLEECLDLISKEEVHSCLVEKLREERSNPQAAGLLYHLSSKHENRQKLFAAGISNHLIEVMRKTDRKEAIDKALAGLLVNMTLYPLCAEYFARNGVIDFVMSSLRKESSKKLDFTLQVLLKVVRNLSVWSRSLQCKISRAMDDKEMACLLGHVSEPANYIDFCKQASIYWEQNFWVAHVSFLWSCTFQCKNDDIVVELVGILNNLTCDDLPAGNQWHNLMEEYNADMMRFLKRVVDSSDGSVTPCYDDLKLEVIIWLGVLCTDKECGCWLVSVLDDVNRILSQSFVRTTDDDLSIEVLFLYEQLLLHEETRFQVIGGDGVIDAIICCLDKGHYLGVAAGTCLALIEDLSGEYDGSLGCYIRQKRFVLLVRNP